MAVVAGGDAPPVLEAAEEPLDDVPTPVDALVERIRGSAGGAGRDHGLDAPLGESASQSVGIIGLVGDQAASRGGYSQQRNRHADIGDVARRQGEGDRSAAIIGQAVDLARPAAARATDRFLPLPLFEPAAERCAFTWLLSVESSSGTGPEAAIFSNRRRQMPRDAHRL